MPSLLTPLNPPSYKNNFLISLSKIAKTQQKVPVFLYFPHKLKKNHKPKIPRLGMCKCLSNCLSLDLQHYCCCQIVVSFHSSHTTQILDPIEEKPNFATFLLWFEDSMYAHE
jgi:hypothetical protein